MPYTWVHIIKSASHYQAFLRHIYDESEDIFPGLDFVIDGVIKCKDGRIFGTEGRKMLLIGTDTFYIYPIFRMIEGGIIGSDSVILIDDISEDEIDLESKNCWFRNGKCFTKEQDLLDYLSSISFSFPDNSFPSRYKGKYEN